MASKFADKDFWVGLADRAISTFAQGTVGAILASSVTNLVDLDLMQSVGIGGLAALVSVLQTIATRGGGGSTADPEYVDEYDEG